MEQAARQHHTAGGAIEFNTIVVRDGIDPQVAHKAFLAIDEYAEGIAPDMEGARGME